MMAGQCTTRVTATHRTEPSQAVHEPRDAAAEDGPGESVGEVVAVSVHNVILATEEARPEVVYDLVKFRPALVGLAE